MIEVIGPWGTGTSIVCAILEANGCHFGRCVTGAGVATDRNPLGIYEHEVLHTAHVGGNPKRCERLTYAAFAEVMEEASSLGLVPAVKLPGVIVSPSVWHCWFAAATHVVWVLRPSKDYTKDKVWDRVCPTPDARRMVWPAMEAMMHAHPCESQWIVKYEDLYNAPEVIIPELCEALGLVFNPDSVELVDKEWPTQKPSASGVDLAAPGLEVAADNPVVSADGLTPTATVLTECLNSRCTPEQREHWAYCPKVAAGVGLGQGKLGVGKRVAQGRGPEKEQATLEIPKGAVAVKQWGGGWGAIPPRGERAESAAGK